MRALNSVLNLLSSHNKDRFIKYLVLFLSITFISFISTSCLFLLTSVLLTDRISIIDLRFLGSKEQIIVLLCIVSIVSITVQEALDYFTQVSYLKFREQARVELATTYLSGILNLKIDDYYATNYTHYIRICYNSSQNVIHLLHAFKEAAIALLSIMLSVLLLGKANIWVLIFLVLIFFVQFRLKFTRKNKAELIDIGFQNENLAKRYTSYLDDLFNLYKEVKIFNREQTLINLANEQLKLVSQSNVVVSKRYIVGGNHVRSFLIVGMLMGIVVMYYLQLDVLRVVPVLVLVLLIVQRIVPAANALHLFTTNIGTSGYLVAEKEDLFQKKRPRENVGDSIRSFAVIDVQNAVFSYGSNFVFSDLTFQIRRNTIVGVVGESGRGKTTFIELLAGLKEYDHALIKIDGKPVSSFNQLATIISFVSQRIYLINDTLKNNITLFDDRFSDAEIWYALEQVNLKSYFTIIPEQLDYPILKGGTNLSVGQAQRIGIARALLYKSSLLIMDEFTASLDHENKMQLCAILLALKDKITIVSTTHDNDIRFIFDEIITL